MSNPSGVTPTITTQAKHAIELYLHGLAVYATHLERRTAEQMYEIRRVSETFSEADHIAYTSNEFQRQWWISAHNAFCDVLPGLNEPLFPAFHAKSDSSSHAINHPQSDVLQHQASHDRLDRTPKTPNEKEDDVLTERKNVSSVLFNSSFQVKRSVFLD